MANVTKLEELMSIGVGGKSNHQPSKRPRPTEGLQGAGRELVRRAIGESMTPVAENLFIAVEGRQTAALRAGLFDVFVVESFAGAPFPSSPTERFLKADFPNTCAQYGSIIQYARSEVSSNVLMDGTPTAEYLIASSLLLPLGNHSVTLAYSFFEYGADIRRAINDRNMKDAAAKGQKQPRPLNRVTVENIFKVFASIARQAASLTPRNGQRLAIGMNRIYGGTSGMLMHDLLRILTEVAALYPHIDWFIISPKNPDDAVLHPFDYARWLERKAEREARAARPQRRQKPRRPQAAKQQQARRA